MRVIDNANQTEVQTSYDAVGNTTRIVATTLTSGTTLQDLRFNYDKMNQETEADGMFLANPGNTGALNST
jgi:hypothetical protein